MRIHMESLLFEVILNIALLVLVATLLSKVQLIQTIISQERRSGAGQVFLSVVFGAVIVLSVYTGIDMDGYNMNTRVIAAIAAGILGGPLVGMYASMIGAVYIYFFAGRRLLRWRPPSPRFCSGFWEGDSTRIFSVENGNTETCFS